MPLPLIKNHSIDSSYSKYRLLAGFEYPEIFVVICSTFLICFQFGFDSLSLTLLMTILLPSLTLIWLNYRNINSTWIAITVVALMAMIAGVMQLSWPISIGFLLLIGMRFIRVGKAYQASIAITAVLTTTLFYFISINLYIDGIDWSSTSYAFTILSLAVFAALWQYNYGYNRFITYQTQLEVNKHRLGTMVSVINKLTRFIPPQIWQPIVKSDIALPVSSKRAKLTVMFSDIAGFTELSDTLSADNLAEILNTYMDRMTVIAERHGAVLDKFIGDGMVCFFGAPTSNGIRRDALDCVAMAIDMRREMRTLRHQWRLQGFDGLYIRIGISTGYCHVGNFGSNNRMSYTLIGREVNLASRLESVSNEGEILISQSTYDYICHEYECLSEGMLELKGFDKPIATYRVLDPDKYDGNESQWVDHDLPGFNLHLNFKDIKNYDYRTIKLHLNQALEHVEKIERTVDNQHKWP